MLLNIVGYSNGQLIPFSVRTHVWLPLEPEPLLPGSYETLRRWGASEGQSLTQLNFSDEAQEESLASWLDDADTRAEAQRRLRIGLALRAEPQHLARVDQAAWHLMEGAA